MPVSFIYPSCLFAAANIRFFTHFRYAGATIVEVIISQFGNAYRVILVSQNTRMASLLDTRYYLQTAILINHQKSQNKHWRKSKAYIKVPKYAWQYQANLIVIVSIAMLSSKDSLNVMLFLCLVHFRNNPEFLKDNVMQFFFFWYRLSNYLGDMKRKNARRRFIVKWSRARLIKEVVEKDSKEQ